MTNINSRENPNGVWDTNYKGVWHLKENPEDSAPQFKDSTLNDNRGTQVNLTSINQVDGKVDGSLSLKGNNNNDEMHVGITHSSSLQLSDDITISVWIKTDDTENEAKVVLAKWGSTGIGTKEPGRGAGIAP